MPPLLRCGRTGSTSNVAATHSLLPALAASPRRLPLLLPLPSILFHLIPASYSPSSSRLLSLTIFLSILTLIYRGGSAASTATHHLAYGRLHGPACDEKHGSSPLGSGSVVAPLYYIHTHTTHCYPLYLYHRTCSLPYTAPRTHAAPARRAARTLSTHQAPPPASYATACFLPIRATVTTPWLRHNNGHGSVAEAKAELSYHTPTPPYITYYTKPCGRGTCTRTPAHPPLPSCVPHNSPRLLAAFLPLPPPCQAPPPAPGSLLHIPPSASLEEPVARAGGRRRRYRPLGGGGGGTCCPKQVPVREEKHTGFELGLFPRITSYHRTAKHTCCTGDTRNLRIVSASLPVIAPGF